MNSIKVSDYLELIKPKYTYIQIIPHKSIRNYNSSNIVKAISDTYKSLNRRIHREQKKLFFETNFKISYIIDISSDNTSFYFLIPIYYKTIILEKISEIWNKATIKEIDNMEELTGSYYSIFYKKDDCLSLNVNKKSNAPLNQILNVADIMQSNDKIRIIYNFLPTKQAYWYDRYDNMIKKIDNNQILDKNIFSFEYVLKATLNGIISTIDFVLDIIGDFIGVEHDEDNNIYTNLKQILNQNNKKVLSPNTINKKDSTIINTQILLISHSEDKKQELNNAISVCNSYNSISEDNELIYKKVNKKKGFNMKDYDYNIQKSLFSTDECQNFIQIPAKELLEQHKINYIQTEENIIPIELQKGAKLYGYTTYKGKTTPTYIEDDYNNGSLPLVEIGSQGCGKSTAIKHIARDCIKSNEGLIVLDFIKDCDVANKIETITPSNKLIVIDLSKEDCLQGFGYNEININPSMTSYKKCELASLQTQQVMNFIDSISTGEPLSGRMRRFLSASSNIVFISGYSSIKSVIKCLEDFNFRNNLLNNLSSSIKLLLEDEINALLELNEYDNKTKELIGTKLSKVEYILDRISILREDFKLKYMYNKSLDNNINLVEAMNNGKTILIKMRESDYPTKIAKNVLVTYWVSKIWLSCQLRGSYQKQPLRCNVIIDEIFQAPTSMKFLDFILPQSRKYGLKFILSCQYLKQLDTIFNSLEASGSAFMLFTGSTENDFNYFKNKFTSFEYEDLKDMKPYHAMCLVKYSKGYSDFICELPFDKKLD